MQSNAHRNASVGSSSVKNPIYFRYIRNSAPETPKNRSAQNALKSQVFIQVFILLGTGRRIALYHGRSTSRVEHNGCGASVTSVPEFHSLFRRMVALSSKDVRVHTCSKFFV